MVKNLSHQNWVQQQFEKYLRSSYEFCVFNEVKNTRNSLVHESFKNGLTQNEIDELRDELMEKIYNAYKMSGFLYKNLFKKYNIEQAPNILFNLSN